MKNFFIVIFILFFLGLTACKNEGDQGKNAEDTSGITTFFLIRHSEKIRTDENNQDPELNQKGLGRAMHWAEILDQVQLDAIYSTNYQRTTMTASPNSVKKNIDIEYFDPNYVDVAQFKIDNRNKNVLVVGHSNTTPQFANALLDENRYDKMDDSDNGSLFIVTIINDVATSQRIEINCSCPNRE